MLPPREPHTTCSTATRTFSSTLNVVWNELCVLCGWFRMWQFQPPSANCALRIASASGAEARIVRFEKVCGEPQPEAEMAEIDALEQDVHPSVRVLVGRDEAIDESAERGLGGRVPLWHATGDE